MPLASVVGGIDYDRAPGVPRRGHDTQTALQRRHLNSLARTLILVYGSALALLAATFAASRVLDRRMRVFSQDATEVLDGAAYVGFLSGIVIVLWSVAATASLLAWLGTSRSARSPYLWSALFVAALLADDLFRLHESYYPQLGLSQPVVATVYGAAGAAYLWFFRDFIRANDPLLFLLGLALLGTSIVSDQLFTSPPWLLEDGAKFLGVVTWATFYVRSALRALAAAPATTIGDLP